MKINNQQILAELQADIEQSNVRMVSAKAGVYEPTLETFMEGSTNMRLNTVKQIADARGYDVEINFIKRNGNEN